MSNSVAVLGGTGFIGRVLAEELVRNGRQVLVVARREPEVPVPGRFRAFDLVAGSAADLAALLREERVTAVVNAAGGMWGLADEQMVDANVTMVQRVVDAIELMPEPVRFVQIGSVHEYGLAPIGTVQAESDEPHPAMAYGRLKVEATELVRAAVGRGADAVVLRVGNVVGAGQPGHSLLGVMAAKLAAADAAGETAALTLAPLTAQRDFVDLVDVVDAIAAALDADGAAWAQSPVLNVGRGEGVSARHMVELLIAASGVPVEITEDPGPVGAGPETEWQCLDVTLVRRVLGWEARRSPAESVASLWKAEVSRNG
jgi:dTDP-6-deoxy-L-talose 4-dehydrogenase [NAD(P)+]